MRVQILDLFDQTQTLANFVALKNEQVVNSLNHRINQFTHISGVSGSGKTHLLKAWVNDAKDKQISSIYLKQMQSDFSINDLLNFKAIAIDNIDHSTDNDQIKLFDLFNKIKLGNLSISLLTSSLNADLMTIREDLRTRILSGLNLHLKALDDNEIIQALHESAQIDGIGISDTELNYLLNHHTRNIGELISIMHKAAEKALIENKRITVPFIKQVIHN